MDTLAELERQVRGCTDCPLHTGRTHAVPGEGPPDAELLFIGEGPGAQEDRQGRPFVGPAGSFLDDLLQSIGMSREQVYIANMVKCRPPNNRDPMPGEIAACRKYLDRQIELIDPLLIVTLGRFSMARFLPGQSISRVRGRLRQVDGRRIFPIMHPAAGLRRQEMRAAIEEDFGRIPALLDVLRMQAEPPPPGMASASAPAASASSPAALREPEAAYEPEPAASLWDAPATSPAGNEATDTSSDRRDVGDDANAAGDTNAGGGESDGDGNVANAAVNKDAGDDANFAGAGNSDTGDGGDDTNAAVNTYAGDGRNDTNIADDTDGKDDSDVADAGDTAADVGEDDSDVADAGDTAAGVGGDENNADGNGDTAAGDDGDNGGPAPAKPKPPAPPATPPPAAKPAPEPPPGQVRMF